MVNKLSFKIQPQLWSVTTPIFSKIILRQEVRRGLKPPSIKSTLFGTVMLTCKSLASSLLLLPFQGHNLRLSGSFKKKRERRRKTE
jgi:hypothetical protein